MSIVTIENFTDFRLSNETDIVTTSSNKDELNKILRSESIEVYPDTRSPTGRIQYRSTRVSGEPIDNRKQDDRWLSFMRGNWSSSVLYGTFLTLKKLDVFVKPGNWCLSMKVSIGDIGRAEEDAFGVYLGNGYQDIFKVNGKMQCYVGTSKVAQYIAGEKLLGSVFGLDIVFSSTSSAAKASVYINNILAGSLNVTPVSGLKTFSFGWRAKYSMGNSTLSCLSFVRDMVISYDDGDGFYGRCGRDFYVQKMLPVEDVDAQWIGDSPHYSLMAQPYPVLDSDAFLTAYKFGQSETYKMQPIDGSRGDIVADVSMQIDARNTGTSSTPVEYTFRGIKAGEKSVDGSSAVPTVLSMPVNPETGRSWALRDLSDFTAGFGIKAR